MINVCTGIVQGVCLFFLFLLFSLITRAVVPIAKQAMRRTKSDIAESMPRWSRDRRVGRIVLLLFLVFVAFSRIDPSISIATFLFLFYAASRIEVKRD